MKRLTADQANVVFDILSQHAGANSDDRAMFVGSQTRGTTEYRFMGWLGFGGKFWNDSDRWYVTAYEEDMNPGRQQIIDTTNAALAALKEKP